MKTIGNLFKNPFHDARLSLLPSILVLLCSVAVNTFVQITSFSAETSWLLQTFRDPEAQAHLAQILALNTTSPALKAAYGLLMTAFVLIFILPAARWYEEKLTVSVVLERAATMLFVPVILTFIATLIFNASFIAGVIIAMFAVVYCMAEIQEAGRRRGKNGHLLIVLEALFLLITALMLLRNHLLTLAGLWNSLP